MHKEAGCGQGFTEPGYEHFENWITTVYHCELIWLVTSLVTGIILAKFWLAIFLFVLLEIF